MALGRKQDEWVDDLLRQSYVLARAAAIKHNAMRKAAWSVTAGILPPISILGAMKVFEIMG